MFLGTHTPRLDDKGRLALPAKFRSELESGLVITKGQERCLFVFPIAEFNRVTDSAAYRSGHRSARARLQPGLLRQCVARGARRAGPDHRAAAVARIRRAVEGERGDRRQHPRRGVGCSGPGRNTSTTPSSPSRMPPRRCCPGCCECDLSAAPDHVRSGLLPSPPLLGALPRRQASCADSDGRGPDRTTSQHSRMSGAGESRSAAAHPNESFEPPSP